jgi:hypothetical protein
MRNGFLPERNPAKWKPVRRKIARPKKVFSRRGQEEAESKPQFPSRAYSQYSASRQLIAS